MAASDRSAVEEAALAASGRSALRLGEEKIGVIEVHSFPALGRLCAFRFLEWAQSHPDGVVALPTGRTPEHFIAWTSRLLRGWASADPSTLQLLREGGISLSAGVPDMASLRFVQLDDFYPMHPDHPNRFTNYVRLLYIDAIGLDADKALLMDGLWTLGCDAGCDAGQLFADGVDLTLRDREAVRARRRRAVISQRPLQCLVRRRPRHVRRRRSARSPPSTSLEAGQILVYQVALERTRIQLYSAVFSRIHCSRLPCIHAVL